MRSRVKQTLCSKLSGASIRLATSVPVVNDLPHVEKLLVAVVTPKGLHSEGKALCSITHRRRREISQSLSPHSP